MLPELESFALSARKFACFLFFILQRLRLGRVLGVDAGERGEAAENTSREICHRLTKRSTLRERLCQIWGAGDTL